MKDYDDTFQSEDNPNAGSGLSQSSGYELLLKYS